MLRAKLVVVGGEASDTEVDLRLPTVIGRGRDVNLTVPHALVSRLHAEVFEKDGRLFVRDLGSLNGTFVNNQRISESDHPLEPEQLLTLGNITFRAVYEIGVEAGETDIGNASDTAKLQVGSGNTATPNNPPLYDVDTIPVDSIKNPRLQANKPTSSPQDLDNCTAPIERPSSAPVEMSAMFAAIVNQAADQEERPGDSDVGSFLKKLPR